MMGDWQADMGSLAANRKRRALSQNPAVCRSPERAGEMNVAD